MKTYLTLNQSLVKSIMEGKTMKNLIKISIFITLFFNIGCMEKTKTNHKPTVYEIIISPHIARENLKEAESILDFVVSKMKKDDHLYITNPVSMETLVKYSPDGDYSKKMKMKKFLRKASSLMEMFKTIRKSDFSQVVSQFKAPEVANIVNERSQRYANHKKVLVLLGDPRYSSQLQPTQSWDALSYPSDAFLVSEGSAFSIEENYLEDFEVHIVFCESLFQQAKVLRDKIKRFYSLYYGLQGAKLLTFTETIDPSRLLTDIRAPKQHKINPDDTKKMEFHSVFSPEEITRLLTQELGDINNLPPRRITQSDQMIIGLKWDLPIDLDLRVIPMEQGEVYYKNKKSYYAEYFKDFLTAPDGKASRAWECIKIKRKISPNDLVVYVNHFGGTVSKDIPFEIRFIYHGKIYHKRFVLNSKSGNRGSMPRTSNSWYKIDLVKDVIEFTS